MRLPLNPTSLADYETFLKVKRLPYYRFDGRTAVVPDEYRPLIKPDASDARSDTAYVSS